MVSTTSHEVTGLLAKWSGGDKEAEEDLFRLVHHELRRIARRYVVRWRRGQTLQTTAVVNEAYVRLVSQRGSSWQDRAHFFAVSAKAMRHILIDRARRARTARHGGGQQRVDIANVQIPIRLDDGEQLLAFDSALERLAVEHPDAAQLVKLHCFAGLDIEDAALALGLTRPTAYRRWLFARTWLYKELAP